MGPAAALLASLVGLTAAVRLLARGHGDCCSWVPDRRRLVLPSLGASFYLTLFAAVSAGSAMALPLAAAGAAVSAVLVGFQVGTRRYCAWCMVSAASSLAALVALAI